MKPALTVALAWFLAWRMEQLYTWTLENRGGLRQLVSVSDGQVSIRFAPPRAEWRAVAQRLLNAALPEE